MKWPLPVTFNSVQLHVMAINEKPWTVTREICRALKYNKTLLILQKPFYRRENYVHKYQIIKFPVVGYLMDWPKGLKKVGLSNQWGRDV